MEITGRLVADATVRETKSDKSLTGFRVAVNRRYMSNGEQVEDTSYFDCSYWRTTAVAPYLTKGMVVHLTGYVSASAWLDKEGGLHAGLNFHVSELNMLTKSKRQPGEVKPEAVKRARSNSRATNGLKPSRQFN